MPDRRRGPDLSRRRLLSLCVAGGLCGCTSLDSLPGTGSGAHPFADRTVTVQLQAVRGDVARLEGLLRDALAFWNAGDRQAFLPYTTTLAYAPDAGAPDVLVSEVASIDSCGVHGGDITGCAPVLRPGERDRLPATLRLTPQPPGEDWHYRRVIEHELGHLLGLGHEDEPSAVMAASWQQRYPQYDRRRRIFGLRQERTARYNRAVDRANDGFEAVGADRFETAAERFRAASRTYQDAASSVETARSVADELDPFEPADRSRLASLLRTEQAFVETALDGLGSMIDGSRRLAAGEDGAATYNDGAETYRAANDTELPDAEAYLAAVGFPTALITGSNSD